MIQAADPVALGKVRAKQDTANDKKQAMGIVLHGDASYTAQASIKQHFVLALLSKKQDLLT